MENFHAGVDQVRIDIANAYAPTNATARKELQADIRKEIREMFIPLHAEMMSHGQSIEEIIFIIKGDEPAHRDDIDLRIIFADLLAQENPSNSRGRVSVEDVAKYDDERVKSDRLKWYHDPITCDIMCDPVKATDNRTYDRWTLIGHAEYMTKSSFDRSVNLHIVLDDIDVRSRLFQKFPEQEKMFRRLR
ncbi:hypothetical protein R1flu_009351 [Riccia fluitans]|uniref:U-box domain-containing protein n=1 Tax=Riccia fluitans TaxID=41844 RepID=A0ABD1Z4C7_9MARC